MPPPIRKQPGLASDNIPLLEDVVEKPAAAEPAHADAAPVEQVAPDAAQSATDAIPVDILSEVLTERITALTDRLLRDASAEIHATLVNKVWEKLRDEIPDLVEAALRENGGDN